MATAHDQTSLRPAEIDLHDVIRYETSRAGGGLMASDGGREPGIYMEITGHAPNSHEEQIVCVALSVDELTGLIARLEHAGKTALLMEA